MQKIEIKNFGAIKNAEIEVRKILVLIGEQATGKSTISKLIYFFKSLKDDLFNQVYNAQKEEFDRLEDLIYPIRNKFYDFFGSTLHLSKFTIIYYYSEKKFIKLSLDQRNRLLVNIDNLIDPNVVFTISSIKKVLYNKSNSDDISEQLAFEQNKLKFAQRISQIVNLMFASNQTNSLFVIAGRNATIAYSDLFEKYLFASVQSRVEENSNQPTKRKLQTIDETLMLKFVEKSLKLKSAFRKFGNFEGLIESYAENKSSKEELYSIKRSIDKILRGEYLIDNWGEKIVIDRQTNEYIYLSNASSGQQESIRILQDIFVNILDNAKVLRIIEEPEAHLFPTAQKYLIELLALMTNQNEDSQLVITTHSPYVLTLFNNLLFASRVVDKAPNSAVEVDKIISRRHWINLEEFAAYSLGNSKVDVTGYCTSVMDSDTRLIHQNYLDDVSEALSADFNSLYSIHTKSFARK